MEKFISEKGKSYIEFENETKFDENGSNNYARFINISNLWLAATIDQRLMELKKRTGVKPLPEPPTALLTGDNPFARIVQDIDGDEIDFTLLATAVASKLYEDNFEVLYKEYEKHPEYGGYKSTMHREFFPTLKTVVFLLNGYDENQAASTYIRLKSSRLVKEKIVTYVDTNENQDVKNLIVRLNDSYFGYLAAGKKPLMGITPDFPAQQMVTERTFNDIVLRESTREQLDDLILFAKYQQEIATDVTAAQKLGQGFIGLFWGPPGTGKSLTASIIGNELGIDVYRIDLSRLVSKYIGETEKNLEKVFQRFDGKNCILFFDEADSLFGKRSEVKDAKDRYANQEISYLLQRVETFSGVVILATNLKDNMDDAFKRRVLSWTYFPRPNQEERYRLWNVHLPQSFSYESDEAIMEIAAKYELTGAYIANVVKLSCIRTLSHNERIIRKTVLEPYIRDIYKREGINKTLPRNPNLRRR